MRLTTKKYKRTVNRTQAPLLFFRSKDLKKTRVVLFCLRIRSSLSSSFTPRIQWSPHILFSSLLCFIEILLPLLSVHLMQHLDRPPMTAAQEVQRPNALEMLQRILGSVEKRKDLCSKRKKRQPDTYQAQPEAVRGTGKKRGRKRRVVVRDEQMYIKREGNKRRPVSKLHETRRRGRTCTDRETSLLLSLSRQVLHERKSNVTKKKRHLRSHLSSQNGCHTISSLLRQL